MVGERPVGPVPLRRSRVGLDGLVATPLADGGEVVMAALPAVIPCAVGATLVSIYGGVSRLGMIGVDHLAVMRCPPASDCRRRAACPGPAVSVELSLATTDRCQDLSARSVLHVGKPSAWETAARRLPLVGMPSCGAAPNARTARGTRMTVGPSRRRWMRLRT